MCEILAVKLLNTAALFSPRK